MIQRSAELPADRSFFLFGPRQTGKSTLVLLRFNQETWAVQRFLFPFTYSEIQDGFDLEAVQILPWREYLTDLERLV
ncbi:MAG: hypothetical protein WC838_03795 [Candidatus Margulisiibacteriota bacterium]|jgi:predicted AAA+ superfamily ATPase